MVKHLPPDYDRRLFYFELMGGTHEDDSGYYQTGDLVVSKYDLAGRYGKKFRLIPFPSTLERSDDQAPGPEAVEEPVGPVQGSDDDGLDRLSLRELRGLAAESEVELPVHADKAQVIARIRRAWDEA